MLPLHALLFSLGVIMVYPRLIASYDALHKQKHVQHVTCEQTHCHARLGLVGQLFSALLFNYNTKFVK